MENQISALLAGKAVSGAINGVLFRKDCGTKETAKKFYTAILSAKADPTNENLEKIYTILNKGFRIAKENGLEYNLDTGEVFFKDFATPLPTQLVETIEEYSENKFPIESILNFWMLLMANPDKRVRKSLFKFIQTHDFALTDNGYLVVYKTVEWFDNKIDNLQTYVTNTAYFIRKEWKCSIAKYAVYRDIETDTYKYTKQVTIDKWDLKEKNVELIGNLKELETKLDEQVDEVSFIPRYVIWNPEKFDKNKEKIVLGVPQKIERKECDSDPSNECSYGLHVGATRYVKNFASSKTAPVLVCFVNPMNVIAVPDYDNSKMRVAEYFPYCLASRDADGNIDVVEQSYFEHDYIAYEKAEIDKLIEQIKKEETGIEMDVNAPKDKRDMTEILKVLSARVIKVSEEV